MKNEESRKAAMRLARRIGCQGAHQNEKGEWLPCNSTEELMRISDAAEKKNPKGLKSAEEPPPCLGCEENKRDKRGRHHKKRWERLRERGVTGIDTLDGGGLVSAPVGMKQVQVTSERKRVVLSEKALNPRQQALYNGFEAVAERFGKFTWDTGPDGSHYTPADKNPFIEEKLVCSNCSFWLGPDGCEIVEGKLEPNAICKFWVIDEDKLPSEQKEKALLAKQRFDYFARDGDLDGLVQDGTPLERRSRTLTHAVIGRRKKPVSRTRLRDLPFPYPTAPVPDVKKLGPSLGRGGKPKPEAVDPNAIDGDNDGLVQEGTTAERPATPRVNIDVRPIERQNAGVREEPPTYYRRAMARKELRRRDADAISQHFADLKKKVLAKRRLDNLESLSDKEIKSLLKKEFPNIKLNDFVWRDKNGAVSPVRVGQVVGLLAAADSLSADDPARKNFGYVDNNAKWLGEIKAAPNVLGVQGVVHEMKKSEIKISLRPFSIEQLYKQDYVFADIYVTRAYADLRSERASGRISKEEFDRRAGEIEQVAAANIFFHEFGHLLHDSRRVMEPTGVGPDAGLKDFAERLVTLGRMSKDEFKNYLTKTKTQLLEQAKKENPFRYAMLQRNPKELEELAYHMIYATTGFAPRNNVPGGRMYWANGLSEEDTTILRNMLAKTSQYGNVEDDALGKAGYPQVMYEGIAEFFGEYMVGGQPLTGVKLTADEQRVAQAILNWFGIK